MNVNVHEFNLTSNELWKGCMLASIAHAIMVAHSPMFAHEHSWDGNNYNIQDSQGARGTVTFHSSYCVAALYDAASTRNNHLKPALEYFEGASQSVKKIAKTETLQYLLEEEDGKVVPVITTSFWGDSSTIYSLDSFNDMQEHSGFILENQFINIKLAKEAWIEYHEMDNNQVLLLESIYQRKVTNPNQDIILSQAEIEMIGTKDLEGLEESRTSFSEIGIKLTL
ncbi:hypothetical protein MUG87_03955 [Ectobacillus sp. JY-23]|jgi:hypothetical protein|uniref:hypothetical protein n=1 Tax=Ectobacillus sp. JY-23 TaxID=2933872 RepID=UPI001FF3ABDA|nr:hypothetical protein [Ectobacillus sp. JY-23]UOY93291.1 hypothetical protein MUG87_03955 [Ectobacillus sp. JY-23]